MPGTPLRFGPFIGGLNTLSDPAAIDDNELVDILNMELDLDGSLISRPAVKLEGTQAGLDSRVITIGVAFFSGQTYVIGSTDNALWYYTVASNTWTQIVSGATSFVALQWQDKLWFIATPGSTKNSGWWTPTAGVYTEVGSMPRGYTAVIHKNRMYVTRGILDTTVLASRVVFSSSLDATTWPGGNSLDVNSGDGQGITRLIVYNDNIVIFKQQSTYVFAFDSDPAGGSVRKISGTIGAVNRYAVGEYENQLYLFHRGYVYEMINYDFNRINQRVPFELDGTGPGTYSEFFFLQVVDERIVVRYYNNIYVFNLRTRTWSRWTSNNYFGPFQVIPRDLSGLSENIYIAGSCIVGEKKYFSLFPKYTATTTETFTCSIKTKNYDLAVGHKFKRLFWWGADMSAVNAVTGVVGPIIYSFIVTWDQLAAYTWDQLQTWDNPLNTPVTTQTVTATNSSARRRFLKFPKSLRFRQAYFTISTTTDGTSATGPVRIFSLTGMAAEKEIVPKAVN